MDDIDRRLLALLQEDASRPVSELAALVGLSTTPCWKRIHNLKEEGIICKEVVLCDPDKLDLGTTVFVEISTNQHNETWLKKFAQAVQAIPEIVDVYRMSGDVDYLLRVVVKDIQGYDAVYRRLIHSCELHDVSSSFAMERIKSSTALPVGGPLPPKPAAPAKPKAGKRAVRDAGR
ncbi:MAG: Lrp/AsnC family transcriptional regulator [Caldimonas sp.]